MPSSRALAVGAVAVAFLATSAPAPPFESTVHHRPRASRAEREPERCAVPGRAVPPIAARLAGGPRTYEAGAAPRAWRLELRNATGTECRSLHPVAVFADRAHALRPAQVRLDFYDAAAARWRPVRFERSDAAESVGAFEGLPGPPGPPGQGGPVFTGFTVPAHGTVQVPVRLGFAPGAPEGPVTASVTAVQRHGGDGDWAGDSDSYTFRVRDGGRPALARTGTVRHVFALCCAVCALLSAGGALVLSARRERP
ncbi:hypothetical protein ACFP1Z_21885 [Streptomyces gamaensis]|uniref:DUF4232 domain-containing protein n=1 Tax=Streptomyces gamaensis TaxID=1763542 RepID=A0ABW0Z6W4_9ACTN